MKLHIDIVSDIGCVRQNNEDMILADQLFVRDRDCVLDRDSNEKNFWLAVADGMGGHNSGEIASEWVLQQIAELLQVIPSNLNAKQLQDFLSIHIEDIHKRLNNLGSQQEAMRGLGTTFTGLLIYENGCFLINIGDSRIYRLRGGLLTQLTTDHTLSNMLKNPDIPSNTIVNSFGGGDKIFFDFEDLGNRVFEKDIFLICSDGLSGELSDEEMEDLLIQKKDSLSLVSLAKQKGGKDNISCVLIEIIQLP